MLAGKWQWTVSPPLVSPVVHRDDPCFGIKDPTVVFFEGRWHLFCTIRSQKRLRQIEYRSFKDWKDADKAEPHVLTLSEKDFCDPQVFYLARSSGISSTRSWTTHAGRISTRSTRPAPTWPTPVLEQAVALFDTHPENVKEWIDFWVICDATRAHLFFTSLDGKMWAVRDEARGLPCEVEQAGRRAEGRHLRGSHTYRLKGTDKYLTVVEALDGKESAACGTTTRRT